MVSDYIDKRKGEKEMKEYHKIQTVFKRDPDTKFKTLLLGEYSLPEFEYLANNPWCFTEKVDGTNIRVMLDEPGVVFGGKTERAQIPATLIKCLQDLFPVDKLCEVFDGSACLYGEGYGAKIQKGGGNYRSDQSFVLFDVKIGDWWLQRADVVDIAHKLGVEVVPVIKEMGSLQDMVDMCRSGITSEWGDFQAEGIVARPQTELCTRAGKRIITKLKCKDFLVRS